MAYNNSPRLVFEPEAEDEKNYTMVTAYINEEFASIREEEKGNLSESTTQKTTQKTTLSTREHILQLMKDRPEISQEEMATIIGVSLDGIKYHIRKLHNENLIKREGGQKEGYWIVYDTSSSDS